MTLIADDRLNNGGIKFRVSSFVSLRMIRPTIHAGI